MTIQELINNHFYGIDVKYRATGHGWPKKVKAIIYSSKHSKVFSYGDTVEEALKEADKEYNIFRGNDNVQTTKTNDVG